MGNNTLVMSLLEANAKLTEIIKLQEQGAELQAKVSTRVAEVEVEYAMLKHAFDELQSRHEKALHILEVISCINPNDCATTELRGYTRMAKECLEKLNGSTDSTTSKRV